MGRCCFYTAGTLSLLFLVTSVTLLVARVFQKAVDQTIEKVRQARRVFVCVCVFAHACLSKPSSHCDSVWGESHWPRPCRTQPLFVPCVPALTG